MKRVGIIILLTSLMFQVLSQEISAGNRAEDTIIAIADTNDNTKVVIGQNLFTMEDDKDAVNLRIGNRGMIILESLENGGPRVKFENFREEEPAWQENSDNSQREHKPGKSHFKGHWGGIELGFNNYLTAGNSTALPDEIDYMSLHSGKSRNINVNFSQISFGLTRHFGFVTGLGLNWNNYMFDSNTNIQKGTSGIIEVYDPGETLKKSKLSTLYLDLPVLLEIQIPTDHNRLNIAAGPIGGVKLLSHSVMVFENGDKEKSDDDFNLNLIRYGATTRIGYRNFNIYGTYYLTPLFKRDKGPGSVDLFPFEIGIAFTIDD
jgi:hypothetical protein